ncbi:MAG: CDP-alcohol phosphatidyltransferase family protein [Gammaproteobacteria bacterium]
MESVEKIRALGELRIRQALMPFVRLLVQFRISPNQLSVVGVLMAACAAAFLIAGYPIAAGTLYLFGSTLDMLDGALARLDNRATAFGAFLDSTLDRVSEGLIFAAIAYRYALNANGWMVVGVVLALLGSFLTSYTRARAESLGVACKAGWATRPERVILVSTGLILNVMEGVICLLALLTALTSLQRIYYAYRHLQ